MLSDAFFVLSRLSSSSAAYPPSRSSVSSAEPNDRCKWKCKVVPQLRRPVRGFLSRQLEFESLFMHVGMRMC
jgi:hypothetical protein